MRVHLYDGHGQPGETLEGIQVGRRPVAGHYILIAARHLEAEDRSSSLAGQVEIPRERVMYLQVLPS